MDSGMIGKIQKAKRYAEQERERFNIKSLVISVDLPKLKPVEAITS